MSSFFRPLLLHGYLHVPFEKSHRNPSTTGRGAGTLPPSVHLSFSVSLFRPHRAAPHCWGATATTGFTKGFPGVCVAPSAGGPASPWPLEFPIGRHFLTPPTSPRLGLYLEAGWGSRQKLQSVLLPPPAPLPFQASPGTAVLSLPFLSFYPFILHLLHSVVFALPFPEGKRTDQVRLQGEK